MERRGGVGETREGSDDRAPAPKPGQASANGVAAPLRAVIGLQKSAGNRAVAGLLSGRSGGGGGAGGGGGGGGGAMKPSTLAGDVGALAQGMAGAQAAAGGAASGLLAAAAPPPGLPVAPEPSLAEPA
ncbi:MAG TPA: hypothetical protein VH479_07840, partial [Acidimicrobiales bacterium]